MNDEVTLTHTVAGGGYDGVEASSVVVTVSDNDRGVTVSETALTVDEEDTTGSSYTVQVRPRDAAPTVRRCDGDGRRRIPGTDRVR